MNKKIYVFGSLIVAGVFALAFTAYQFLPQTALYRQAGLSILKEGRSTDAIAWLKARYIDVNTGNPVSNETLAKIEQEIRKMGTSKSIVFESLGPDNIGGRTRAICVDRSNINRVWAGGVSGGLFVSNNKGNFWERVLPYVEAGGNPFISSMTMTPDNTLYVATGSNDEGWGGNGVWYSTDFGATFAKIPGTTNCTEVGSSDADNNVWLATSSGLKKWKVGDAALTSVPATSGGCFALQVSKNGQVIVAAYAANKTFVSTDGGNSFTDKSGTIANNLVPTGAARIEYAISPTQNSNGAYSLYAARTNSNLLSMHVSHDNGQTWNQFVGPSGPPNEFDIYRDQGTYNSILSVDPTNSERLLIGGIDVWEWKQTVNNPPSGGFEKISLWFVNPSSPTYVHADNHEMKWDNNNRFYVGNDGGVGVSNNKGATWFPANRGYNVTQFYGIAFDAAGRVMGGTQDNGTLYNDFSLSTYHEFREVNGGDGFECEISFFNPSVMFSSIYYNSISRSGDRGVNWTNFSPNLPGTYDPAGTDGSPNHPFHTELFLAEYFDPNSQDSVTFIPKKNYAAGAQLRIPSMASGDTITTSAPTALYFDDTLYYDPSLTVGNVNYGINNATGETVEMGSDTVIFNVSWDTLRIADPYQSWFLVYVNANGGELWGSRNATRFSVTNPGWLCVAKGIGGGLFNSVDVEFSRDLNHCYISAGNGVWRLDGLGDIYTSDPNFASKAGYVSQGPNITPPTATTLTKITNTSYEGIAINRNNENDLVCFAGFNGTNKRTNNATAASPTFTNLGTIVAGIATYDGIIDRNDSDILVVGTSSGAWVSENGGATWENASTGFEGTPVYEVLQNWRSFDEGNGRPGEIYLGTFGRGIWRTTQYLGTNTNTNTPNGQFKTKLRTYPNPTKDNTTLVFELAQSGKVEVQVYSITGRLVWSKNLQMADGTQELSIDSADLPAGTYIVKFNAGKQTDTAKFIKM
ncbi:MAG: T9SS type A sorting domain-containing protein [Crocinitomicaceae bacterium]|nr:T9SS type A sorting domain-containing protein [Crocinitomicaceae bacterium]MDP5065933.1 T9SS type A sorting domain-containing protein [Crocinitomicaceae bacterium]